MLRLTEKEAAKQKRNKGKAKQQPQPGLKEHDIEHAARKGPTEKQVQAECITLLRYKKWLVIRNQQNIGSTKGITDITAIKNGVVWWIEFKSQRGKLSEDQERFRDEIKSQGGNWLLAKMIDDLVEMEQISWR